MSPIVVRFDLSPDAAEVAHRALGVYLDEVVIKPLAQEPVPQHTKRRLEEQRAHLEATRRDLKRAMGSPIEVDDLGHATTSDLDTYRIVRFHEEEGHADHRKVIETGLSLLDAQTHCRRNDTHEAGVWFDGYEKE